MESTKHRIFINSDFYNFFIIFYVFLYNDVQFKFTKKKIP
jgi:hypothetical protein